MSASRTAVLEDLRRHISRVAPARVLSERLPTGIEQLDLQIGGWPRPGVSAICGPLGSGRLSFVLPAMVALTHRGRSVAVVDPMAWLNPPGLKDVVLQRVILVRPGPERACWATEQLCRCSDLDLVVLLDPPPFGRVGRRLQYAAEQGTTSLVVLHERPDSGLPATLRLQMTGRLQAQVLRGRAGCGPIRVPGELMPSSPASDQLHPPGGEPQPQPRLIEV